MTGSSELRDELAAVLNRHSAESGSDTPDFLLASYLLGCLTIFDAAVKARDTWYGVELDNLVLPAQPRRNVRRGIVHLEPAEDEYVVTAIGSEPVDPDAPV